VVKNRQKLLIAIYLGVALYLLPMYPHGGSANELTRWATAASLIENGSFEISWTEPLIGPNVDTARVGDRVYSNKAPGPAIVAAPVYALTRLFTGPPDASNIRISWFAMRLVISTMPLLLLAVWLYRRGTGEFGMAALLFATPLFVYSLLFFSHVFAAVLVYAAFRLLYDEGELRPLRFIAAGMAAGLAVISEFPAVFAAAVLGVGLLFADGKQRLPRAGYFLLGALPFAAFLLIYNNAVFGSPFSLSYAHESFPEWAAVAGQGVFGIGVPTLSNAYLLLVSPSRGLLFFSPILILSLINFLTSAERATLRHRVKAAAVIASVLLLCGHGAAHGGWAFGARYLVFVLPLMLDSILRGEMRSVHPAAKGGLFALSFVLCALPILTFPFAPPEFAFPHNDLWTAFMRQDGWFVPTFANVFGLPSGVLSVLPAILCAAAVLIIVSVAGEGKRLFSAGVLAGLLIAGAYIFVPDLASGDAERFRRATIAERFFRPAGRLETERASARRRNDPAAVRLANQFEWTVANARAYAPDDWPYLQSREMGDSPTAVVGRAAKRKQMGDTAGAIEAFAFGKSQFPGLKCEFAVNLATLYFTNGDKQQAQAELESVVGEVDAGSAAGCLRSQFLLGSLYNDLGREADSQNLFKSFLANSNGSSDVEIIALRKQLGAK